MKIEKRKQKENKKLLIGCCGICCSFCPGYRSKNCPGCLELKDCKIRKCAISNKKRYCFKCKQFPCKLYEKGFKWDLNSFDNIKEFKLGKVLFKPYSKEYVALFKLNNIKPFIKKQK